MRKEIFTFKRRMPLVTLNYRIKVSATVWKLFSPGHVQKLLMSWAKEIKNKYT